MEQPQPLSALHGRSVGGLGGRKLRFRPQLFWMEVLPEHAASSSLDFTCDFASGKNFARVPTDTNYAADDRLTRSVACAVAEHDVDEGEAAKKAWTSQRLIRVVDDGIGKQIVGLLLDQGKTVVAPSGEIRRNAKTGQGEAPVGC